VITAIGWWDIQISVVFFDRVLTVVCQWLYFSDEDILSLYLLLLVITL
jgi:hypothetical protein